MKELNVNELESVNGGFGIPGAIAGGLFGAVTYLAQAATSGSGSFGGFAVAVGGGAFSGAVGGGAVSVARAYLGTKVSFTTGAVAGLAD